MQQIPAVNSARDTKSKEEEVITSCLSQLQSDEKY